MVFLSPSKWFFLALESAFRRKSSQILCGADVFYFKFYYLQKQIKKEKRFFFHTLFYGYIIESKIAVVVWVEVRFCVLSRIFLWKSPWETINFFPCSFRNGRYLNVYALPHLGNVIETGKLIYICSLCGTLKI